MVDVLAAGVVAGLASASGGASLAVLSESRRLCGCQYWCLCGIASVFGTCLLDIMADAHRCGMVVYECGQLGVPLATVGLLTQERQHCSRVISEAAVGKREVQRFGAVVVHQIPQAQQACWHSF